MANRLLKLCRLYSDLLQYLSLSSVGLANCHMSTSKYFNCCIKSCVRWGRHCFTQSVAKQFLLQVQ